MRPLLLIMSLAAICPVMSCAWVAPMGRRHGTLIEYRWAQGDDRSPPGLSHQVGDTVVLGLDGIDHAEVRPFRIGGDSAWSVIVRLTPPAATAFADATAAHVGRTIVVLMHDRIVTTAVVQSRLGAAVPVVSSVSRVRAEAIAREINAAKTPTHRGGGP